MDGVPLVQHLAGFGLVQLSRSVNPCPLKGYDQFMNIVLDNTVEIVSPTEKNEIGMVVIRGKLF